MHALMMGVFPTRTTSPLHIGVPPSSRAKGTGGLPGGVNFRKGEPLCDGKSSAVEGTSWKKVLM